MDPERIQADIRRTERLLEELGYTSALLIRHLDPPEPDVAVETPDGVIGVELTELNPKGQQRRKHEEEQDRVTQAAKELCDAAGLSPLEVKVFWSGHGEDVTMTRARRSASAEQLMEFVSCHAPADGSPVFLNADRDPELDLPEGVYHVSIMRLPSPPSFWSCPRVDWPREVAVEDLDPVMVRKNGKVKGYRGQYHEIWLLMVTGASGPATWGRVPESIRCTRFASPFNRAFLLNLVPVGLVELKVDFMRANDMP